MTEAFRIRPALAALFTTEFVMLLTVLAVTGSALPAGIA